jgi:hypothetical protein
VTEYKTICAHLSQAGIECEPARAGWFSMAVPLNVTKKSLKRLVGQCPVPLECPSLS